MRREIINTNGLELSDQVVTIKRPRPSRAAVQCALPHWSL